MPCLVSSGGSNIALLDIPVLGILVTRTRASSDVELRRVLPAELEEPGSLPRASRFGIC